MTYEELAKRIADRVLEDVVMMYPLSDYEGPETREEDWQDIYDKVFGELVDQHEAE
jgi:ketosteroid isomerase-like protein